MLYIPVLYLATLTTLIYLRSLNPDTPYEFLNNVVIITVTLWGYVAANCMLHFFDEARTRKESQIK